MKAHDWLLLLGVCSVVGGAGMVYLPAAPILLGVLLIAGAVRIAREQPKDANVRKP